MSIEIVNSTVVTKQVLATRPLPLLAIVIAQQSVLFPLYFFIPLWVTALNIIVAFIVFWSHRQNKQLLTRWVKVAITVIAIAGIFISFHKFSGRDAGVALISVMYGLKILETKKMRDANVLLSLGFFILVSGFLFSQKPWIAFYQVIPVMAILNALVAMHSINSEQINQVALKGVLKKLSKYLVFALPIMLIFFIFFPRLGGPIWRMPGASSGTTGISTTMTPGDISSLRQSDDIAFRVKFDGVEPSALQMYWRVLVLDDYDGISWFRKGTQRISDPLDSQIENFNRLQQFNYAITLEPTRQNFLVTLDRPIKTPANASLLRDYVTYSSYRILDRTRYKAISAPEHKISTQLSIEQRQKFIQLNRSDNPKSRNWARLQRQLYNSDWDYIYSLLEKINRQEYFYTLRPPIMAEDMVDSFWFENRRGFCEHYAGTLAFLARAADIPARVVIGYQGGEKNPLSDYWIVRSKNAHAWTEIWIEGRGWVRVDPTSAIAPHRVEEELVSDYRIRDSLFDEFEFEPLGEGGLKLLKQFEFWTDQFNNRWNDWILDYNSQTQRDLFKSFGFSGLSKSHLIIIMIISILVFTLLTSMKWFHQNKVADPLALAYLSLLKKLDKKNIKAFDPCLGPQDLKRHLSKLGVLRYQALIYLLDEYIRLRYREEKPEQAQVKEVTRQLKAVSLKKREA